MFDLSREIAYNMSLIYLQSGAKDYARYLLYSYCVIWALRDYCWYDLRVCEFAARSWLEAWILILRMFNVLPLVARIIERQTWPFKKNIRLVMCGWGCLKWYWPLSDHLWLLLMSPIIFCEMLLITVKNSNCYVKDHGLLEMSLTLWCMMYSWYFQESNFFLFYLIVAWKNMKY